VLVGGGVSVHAAVEKMIAGNEVGVGVGIPRGATAFPVQANNKNTIPPNQIFILFIVAFSVLERVVQVPEYAQTLQCKPWCDDLNHVGFLGNDLG